MSEEETTEAVVETEEVQTEAVEEQQEETKEEVVEEKSEEVKEPPKKKKSIDDRLKELGTATYKMRERERAAIEKENAVNEKLKKIEELQSKSLKRPNQDDYDSVDDFKRDDKIYSDQVISAQVEQRVANELQERESKKAAQDVQMQYNIAKEQAIEKDPAFIGNEMKVERMLKVYGKMWLANPIISTDKPTEIVSYLAKNLDELESICQLPEDAAMKKIHILEYKMGRTSKKTTKPPAPITPVAGGEGAKGKNLNTMTQKEYNIYMNSK